ncbi:MAG: pyrroline-5-carboxylate reductase [Actinobacteria bacterium]|nr:pyrroline-5-carboxylate reductase [Actinomycetota bacterium]
MTTALLGVGMMGENLLAGLLASGFAPQDVVGTDLRPQRQREIADTYGVRVVGDNVEAVSGADTVVVVVKPYDVAAVLDGISGALSPDALVVSLAAGVELAVLEAHLPAGQPVVRVMPNTPASVGEGMSAIAAGSSASEDHLARVADLLGAVGRVVTVPERHLDAVTAVSGSGPAYVMYVAEAMIDAGVLLGLPRDIATTLTAQTLYGSAKLLRDSGTHPAVLRENVTSPGGTTAAALRTLDDRGVKAAFVAALEACRDRSQQLAAQARTS